MSNLVKQYNVVQKQDSIRVIDYNSRIEQRLAELSKEQNGDVQSDTFRSLDAITEEVTLRDPEEIIREAEEAAEQKLSEAEKQADILVSSAQEKADEVLRQAQAEGQRAGYAAGEKEAREILEVEYKQKQAEVEFLKNSLQNDYNRELHDLEPKLLDVILEVVQKVFHIQFDDKKEILLYLIENAITNIEGSKNFHIRVGEEQRAFIEKNKDVILERVGHDITLEILSDPALDNNQCVIETESGFFDCSLGVQLENLIKDLKSLSS